MIPKFPEFKALTLDDRKLVEEHTHKFDPYSDFNFYSLWAWDTDNKRKISELNGNLVVQITEYDSGEPLLSFLGTEKQSETAKTLIAFAATNSISKTLHYLPEVSVSTMNDEGLSIQEDRGNFDYIFSVKDIAELVGNKYGKKRQLKNLFVRNNPNTVFTMRDIANVFDKEEIMSVIERWENMKKSELKDYDLEHELVAIERLLEVTESGQLAVSYVTVDGKVVAFSIEEMLPNKSALAHFSKFDTSFRGINEFLNYKIANALLEKGYVSWNWEQDLDLQKLRYSKMSYEPASFLKKYRVGLSMPN
jgi:hypothetical protein